MVDLIGSEAGSLDLLIDEKMTIVTMIKTSKLFQVIMPFSYIQDIFILMMSADLWMLSEIAVK